MPFIDKETSLIESRPEELYLFEGTAIQWKQNSGSKNIVWDGDTWYAKHIGRSSKTMSTNALKNKMELHTTLSNEVVIPFLTGTPDYIVRFTLYRGQWGDYVPYFRGYIEEVEFSSREVKIVCSPLTSRLKRYGLQRKFSLQCGVPLYSTLCKLSRQDYKVIGILDSVAGLTLTSSSFATKPDNYFRSGYIEALGYSRMVKYHIGNTMKIVSPIPDLAAGKGFIAYMGCGHTLPDCVALGNVLNFQGHPDIPHKNPFVGDAIV